MDEETFLKEVTQRLDIPIERAEQTATAVLQVLRQRIGPKEAADLDAQLPAGLKRLWQEPGPEQHVSRFHKDEFFRRVAIAADLPETDIPRAVKVIFKVLQKALRSPTGLEGEAWDVMSNLPKDLKKLWTDAARLSDSPPKPKQVKAAAI